MRFVHITDTHIGPTPDYEIHGFHALSALQSLVDTINSLPFQPDFVLHTGDVTNDHTEESYKLARSLLEQIKYPIYYVMGNHDRPVPMLRALLDKTETPDRYDYYTEISGFGLAVFDTRGPVDPAGIITDRQLAALRELCKPSGPPLIIAIHHQPVKLDADWLDNIWENGLSMPLANGDAFRAALAPARDRIRGVFCGHVHRGFQAIQDGILYCAAASACFQYESWPGQPKPIPARNELPVYNVVTVTDRHTLVRQYTVERSR